MATLTNTKIKDTYPALLKATDNGELSATEKVITDGVGNASVLKLGTGSASFTGDVDVTDSVLSVSDTANGTTLSLDASAGNSIYSDAPLNIYTVSDDMLFATGGANSTRMTIDALGDISIEENLSVGGSLTSTEDATINGLTIGKGNGSLSTNTVIGVNALDSVTSGVDNTAVGSGTMQNITEGVDNAAYGTGAMVSTTTGSYNTSLGSASLPLNTTGGSNTAVGHQVMQSNTTGGANTVVGMSALNDNTEGNRNTTLGFGSGNGIITGSDNVHIGYNTNSGASDVTNEIVIGSGATGNGSNTATYGNASITAHHFTSGSVNVTGNLTVDTNTLFVDAANNRVGIGTTSVGANSALVVNKNNGYLSAVSNIGSGGATNPSYDNGIHLGFNRSNGNAEANIIYGSPSGFSGHLEIGSWNGSIYSERMRIDSSGRVGIGAVPTRNLQVHEPSANSSGIKLSNSTTGATINDGFDLVVDSVGNAYVAQKEALPLIFLTSDTEAMRIDSSGNVGIGTSSPSEKLSVSGNIETSDTFISKTESGGNTYRWQFLNSVGDLAFRYKLNDGSFQERMRIDASGNVGIGTNSPTNTFTIRDEGYQIAIIDDSSGNVSEILSSNDSMGFFADRGNAVANSKMLFSIDGSERMRIDSSGRVGIGTSSPAAAIDIDKAEGLMMRIKRTGVSGEFQMYQGTDAVYLDSAAAGGNLILSTVATERMRIDASGNLSTLNSTAVNWNTNISGGNVFGNASGSSFIVKTNSLNTSFNSAFAVDGTHSSQVSTINIKALGVYSAGYDSELAFHTTAGTTLSERMRIDSSGNVSIASGILELAAQAKIIGSSDNLKISADPNNVSGSSTIEFLVDGSEKVRIDSSGRVGIGSSSPADKLVVIGDVASTGALKITGDSSTPSAGAFVHRPTSNTLALGTASTERMRITSGGEFGFGTNADNVTDGAIYFKALKTANTVIKIGHNSSSVSGADFTAFYYNNTQIGGVAQNGTTGVSFNTSSDYRLKENVVPMEGALDRVDALKPSRFNFIADADKTVDGFLAHEVQAIVPEAVTGEKDAVDEEGNPVYQGIDQSKIVPLLVGAIKELKAEIETLKSQING